ncbi:MAG: hypothetical protein ACRERC_11975 [Candidatus Binatia bacterium]
MPQPPSRRQRRPVFRSQAFHQRFDAFPKGRARGKVLLAHGRETLPDLCVPDLDPGVERQRRVVGPLDDDHQLGVVNILR